LALVAAGCVGNQSADKAGTPNSGAARSTRNAADDLVRRVEDAYRNQEGLIAKFRQRAFSKTFGLPSVNDGKVYLKKPGKMRLDYFSKRDTSKVSRSLISNGKMIWAVNIDTTVLVRLRPKGGQRPRLPPDQAEGSAAKVALMRRAGNDEPARVPRRLVSLSQAGMASCHEARRGT
jgi:outer membrane lipoprotein-sorting protein